jgi:hypothetical protein
VFGPPKNYPVAPPMGGRALDSIVVKMEQLSMFKLRPIHYRNVVQVGGAAHNCINAAIPHGNAACALEILGGVYSYRNLEILLHVCAF